MESQPKPPTALAPTDVPPFTNVAHTGPPPGTFDIPESSIQDILDTWIYVDNVPVTSAMSPGTKVFKFETAHVINQTKYFPPMATILNCMYSGTYDIHLKIIPVKLASSRVSFNWGITYVVPMSATDVKSHNNYFADSGSFSVDSAEEFIFNISPFYNGVPAKLAHILTTSFSDKSLPIASFDLNIRQPYMPNALQPLSMDLVVLYRIVPTSIASWIVDPNAYHIGLTAGLVE